MILAGDIGGTNTRLAYFEAHEGRPKPLMTEVYPSGKHASFDEIVHEFVDAHEERITGACFVIAGSIKNGVCETPNLPWVVVSRSLADQLGLERVELVNDLEANAHGISALEDQGFVVLNPGTPNPSGNCALISAGTGLGEAGLHWEGDCYQPFASEGGHVDFAPRNKLEVEFLLYLLRSHEHVSYDRLLSGCVLFPGAEIGKGEED